MDFEGTKSVTPKKAKDKKSKKKKDHSAQTVTAKVEVIHDNPSKLPPFVGYFPSGFNPLKPSDAYGSSDFQVYRSRTMPKRMQLVVSPAGAPVEFVGTNYSGEAATGHRSNYALGVFDKETKTLKIMPIAGNKIIRLDPKIKGLEPADKEPATSTIEELTPQERVLKQRQITNVFGTKKDIEKAQRNLFLNQGNDAESQRNLIEKMKNVVANQSALENTSAHVSRNIPPHNLSATTPEDAYILDKIILTGEWNYLEDIYYMLQRGEADFSTYPTFVCNRIERVKKITDESEKKKMCCIFSFINHLIKFKDQNSMDYGSVKNHKIPVILHHRFSSMFSVSEAKRLPPEKINLLISYVLVMTLFSDGFQTDFKDIAKDLKMDPVVVRPIYEHLGCKIRMKDKKPHATLPVPLVFPELKQKRRKRS